MTAYVDALIPAVIGMLLLLWPRLFTKAEGEKFIKVRDRLRICGLVLFGSAALLFLANLPQKTEEAPTTVMHRQNVSTKDANGWYPAHSTEGGFSVMMPLPFSDFTIAAKREDGGPFRMHFIGAKSTDGFKFTVTGGRWYPKKPDLRAFYEGFKKPGSQVTEPVFSESGGFPSVTFEAVQEGSGSWVRQVVTPDSLYGMVIEYPEGQRDAASRLVEPFLNSLRIENQSDGAGIPAGGTN